MPDRVRHREVLPKTGAYVLAGFAVIAPQLLGGATPETELAILLLGLAASLVATSLVYRTRRDLGTLPWAGVGLGIAVVWTLIQLVPLPCAFVSHAYPDRADLVAQLMALKALDAPRCTISGAPGSTRASLALASLLLLLACSGVVMSRAGQRRALLQGIALSAVTMALVAIGHFIANTDKVFGMYAPKQAVPGLLLAPLLNANHLAGLLALGFPLCLALGLTHERLDMRIAWLSGAFLVFTASMFTLSRGGAGAIALGAGGYLVFHVLRWRRRRQALSPQAVVASGVAVVVVAAGAFVGGELVVNTFRDEGASLDKLAITAQLLELARRHPWLGVGRGALGDASPEVFPANARLLYAENFVAQWCIEWGLVATALILFFLGASLVRLRFRRRHEFALACGLLALVVQNLVDYSLEIAGVASVAALGFGALISREQAHPWAGRLRLRLHHVQPASALVAGAAVLFAVPVLTREARPNVIARLEQLLESPGPAFDLELSQALLYYPMDPALIVYGSARAVRAGAKEAPKWLNLAMRVAASWHAPHLQAAYYFERSQRLDEAAVELGLAADIEIREWWQPAREFLARRPNAELALATTALGEHREISIDHVLNCLVSAPTEAERLAKLALAENPTRPKAYVTLAEAAARRGDEPSARAYLAQAIRQPRANEWTWASYLDILHRLGHSREALAKFRAAPAQFRTSQTLLGEFAAIAASQHDLATLETALSELIRLHGSNVSERARLEVEASRLYSAAGDPFRALIAAQSAFDAMGTPELAELTHSAALRANMTGLALRMAAELCHVAHRDKWYCSNPTLPPP